MSSVTNVQTDLLKEVQELKHQLALLQEKDRQNIIRIDSLKSKLRATQQNSYGKDAVRYQALFENVPIAVFRTSAQTGEILHANPMVWKILACDPQDKVSALNFYANPEDRANLLRDLKQFGKVEDREIQIKKLTGETIWATLSAVYYPQEDAIEGVMMDISRIKDTIIQLQKANYELDNFVYHASHDLRSPLRSIMGLINLLRLEKTTSGKEHCLEMIEGSIKRLDNLVIDLLQISKGSRSGTALDQICMVTEINNSITNFYHIEDSSDIRIITRIYQPVDFISDLTRIRIVLNNLISNAIKYRVQQEEQSHMVVTARVGPDKMVIKVEDNGQGIPEAKLSTIFDMFVRATDHQQGSGLGLYIVKNVVEKLGGKINVTSKEQVGTSFEVELPNLAT